ncbi:MAG TPA: SpoIID/LytB domain-containing protein [bacterium]|nr:SpoIID/LytB domain-containing protein [bacterium]
MTRVWGIAALLLSAAMCGCGAASHSHGGSSSPTPTPTGTSTPAPIAAYCQITVTGKGVKAMEDDYLPHVVHCENGGAGPEALKEQAVAARSYAYYKIETSGAVSDGQGDQVYTCSSGPTQAEIDAVNATRGQILVYHGDVIAAFFVAGAKPSNHTSCVATASDPDSTNTEQYVTYNEGKSGTQVTQTTLGYVNPSNYRNRGCMSQWGSRCLDSAGASYADMVQFYYGMDIGLDTAPGTCTTGVAAPEPPVGVATPMPPPESLWAPEMRVGPSAP